MTSIIGRGDRSGFNTATDERAAVWHAFANCFLDTQLSKADYAAIGAQAAASRFGIKDVERIFRAEVAPAFAFNLRDIAGEWQGWSPEFVVSRVRKVLGSRLPAHWRLLGLRAHVDAEWAQLAEMIVSLRRADTDGAFKEKS